MASKKRAGKSAAGLALGAAAAAGGLYAFRKIRKAHQSEKPEPPSRVLVYGAGVIGSFLAHVLCEAGQDVTVLARGKRLEQLKRDGLVTQDYFTGRKHRDKPRIIEKISEAGPLDIVFAVMQYNQMPAILDDLADADTSVVVLVGNNLSAPEMKHHIEERISETNGREKTVLFGFQGTAGNREKDRTVLISFGPGSMSIGGLGEAVPPKVRSLITSLFNGTAFRLSWQNDMDAFLKHHMDLILPAVWYSYAHDCDLRGMTGRDCDTVLDASYELCRILENAGIPLPPDDDEAFYKRGVKRDLLMKPMLLVMAKTKLGELAATDHCRHAVKEMQALEEAFMKLIPDDADIDQIAYLRAGMPSWTDCQEKFN